MYITKFPLIHRPGDVAPARGRATGAHTALRNGGSGTPWFGGTAAEAAHAAAGEGGDARTDTGPAPERAVGGAGRRPARRYTGTPAASGMPPWFGSIGTKTLRTADRQTVVRFPGIETAARWRTVLAAIPRPTGRAWVFSGCSCGFRPGAVPVSDNRASEQWR